IEENQIAHIQTDTQQIIPPTNIQPLFGQALIAQGGHTIMLYKEAGELKADVEMNAPQGFNKTYEGLEVVIEQEGELSVLPQLNQKSQQRRIHLQPAQGNQPAKIVIYKGAGLMGGGNPDSDGEKKGSEEEEEEPQSDVQTQVGNTQQLTTAASLHTATEQRNINKIKELVNAGVNINLKDNNSWTSLHKAAQKGHIDVAAFLISLGADVNARDNNGITPLYVAALLGHLELIRYFIAFGANVNAKNTNGNTPLYMVALKGNLALVRYLI
ncbi:hypothetical protein GR268_42830, partial [Rhizobium leguminosarum]|nr:hypothetical protein [Rhizobium leguminosarum]